MSQRKGFSVLSLALLMTFAAPQAAEFVTANESLIAQTDPQASPVPTPFSVPPGARVQIDGSESLTVVNEELRQRYEEAFEGATVEFETSGTPAALQALRDGEIEIASIGRVLTEAEKAEGLQEIRLPREKIAIIVSPESGFTENLTFEQFAQIFRGDINDWSELGGEPGPIRFVDRPEVSDTRLAISEYDVWERLGGFIPGETVDPVEEDSTDAVVEALGEDGIGYAIYSKVRDRDDVTIIPMHQTLPDDPAYPYSQPRVLVYRGDISALSPAAQALLAVAAGETVVAAASADGDGAAAVPADEEAAATPTDAAADPTAEEEEAAAAPTDATAAEADDAAGVVAAAPPADSTFGLQDWMPWAALILLGLLPFLLKLFGGRSPAPVAGTVGGAGGTIPGGAVGSGVGTPGALGAAGVAARDRLAAGRSPVGAAAAPAGAAGTGLGTLGAAAAGTAGAAALAALLAGRKHNSRITLTPEGANAGRAVWNTPDAHHAEVKQQGGQAHKLRIYDVTGVQNPEDADLSSLAPVRLADYDVTMAERDRTVPLTPERDYLAEVGYTTAAGGWLPMARSQPVRITQAPGAGLNLPGGAAAAGLAGAGALAALAMGRKHNSRVSLTPHSNTEGRVEWTIPEAHHAEVKQQGGQAQKLRIYDVTGVQNPVKADLGALPTVRTTDYDVTLGDRDRIIPLTPERDYLAEVGYTTANGRWIPMARSQAIRLPQASGAGLNLPVGVAAGAAGLAGAGALAALAAGRKHNSRITLAPRDASTGYAYWETPEAHHAEMKQQGGQLPKLRLYDVTGVANPVATDLSGLASDRLKQYDISATDHDYAMPLVSDRDYLAEVGYITPQGSWLPMARSQPIRLSRAAGLVTDSPENGAGLAGAGLAAAALAGGAIAQTAYRDNTDDNAQSAVEASKYDVGQQTSLSAADLADVDAGLPDLPGGYGRSSIVLMPRDPQWAYTYWDTPNEHKEELRRQGGQTLALRLYDVTDITDPDQQRPHNMQEYPCDEMARDWYLGIPVSDRDYLVEIGYLTADGRWLMLARSNSIRVPPIYPSDWYDEHFLTVGWNDDLRGKTLFQLQPPGTAANENPIYAAMFDMAQSAEAQRVAGSLFGSMQHLPGSVFGSAQMASGQAIESFPTSSFITQSGIGMGMGAVPTFSGIGMSGVGFFASMPPLRARKFWLVADAELIVYGATEPDATVYINGEPIELAPDGTFRFQMSFQDGQLDFPILAVAADGEQTRAIRMNFNRETPYRRTNTKDEAIDEPF